MNRRQAAALLLKRADGPAQSDALMVTHNHTDRRKGVHKDIRFVHPAASNFFSTRAGLPGEGKNYLWFEGEDHSPNHDEPFHGEIPAGAPGAGRVEHVGNAPIKMLAEPHPDRLDFEIADGDDKGKYSVRRINGKNWLAKRLKEDLSTEKKADIFSMNPALTTLLYPYFSQMGFVPPATMSVHDPIVGMPAEKPAQAPSGILAQLGKAFAFGGAAGAGFGIGQRLTGKRKKSDNDDEKTAADEDYASPEFPMGPKPASIGVKPLGHHYEDLG